MEGKQAGVGWASGSGSGSAGRGEQRVAGENRRGILLLRHHLLFVSMGHAMRAAKLRNMRETD